MSTADDAWQANRALSHLWLDKQEAFIRGHDEGYRRALEDAADAWNRGQWSRHYAIPKQSTPAVEKWLRDRAAGVGTKDGDDDRPHVHQWIQAHTEWGTPYKYCSCGERYPL